MTTLFLGGDTMTGRGIDQILPQPVSPELYEPSVNDARRYVALAEHAHGPLPRAVPFSYVWGDALGEIERHGASARVVNLETSITRRDVPWPEKQVHYRMSPKNVPCLAAAGFDVVALANNHVLDWGRAGLEETLASLASAGIQAAGAGRDLDEALRPVAVPLPGGRRLLVASVGCASSGIPDDWAAGPGRSGIALVDEHDEAGATRIATQLRAMRAPGDLAVVSIHWGSNWGYSVTPAQRRFAHRLIDEGVDVVHGHSSHHPRPLEVYRGRLVLYGCGELVDDYEGIPGYEAYRGDLVLLYFPTLGDDGALVGLRLTPMRIHRMRLVRASHEEARFLRARLAESSAPFGARFDRLDDGDLALAL